MTDQAELFSTRMVGRALEVRSPKDWMARWGCDQWQLGVTGQKRKAPLVGLGPAETPQTPREASL